jgi:hypothetical protein
MNMAVKLPPEKFKVRILDPFFVFEVEDFFSPAEYETLRAEFPDKSLFPQAHVDRGHKSFLNNSRPEFAEFLKTSRAWTAFCRSFLDPTAVKQFYDLVAPLPSERPASQRKPWRLVVDPIAKRDPGNGWLLNLQGRLGGYTPVTMSFEFSYLETGCYIPPHTDNKKKLISLMFYFPDEGVAYGESAGTEFYRGKNNTPARRAWRVGMLKDEAAKTFYDGHEIFHASRFEGNKLVGFVKSAVSWHGVRSLQIPKAATRRSFNVNYYTV